MLSFRGTSQLTPVPFQPQSQTRIRRARTAPAVFWRHTAQEQHKDEEGLTATQWEQSQLSQPSMIHQRLLEKQSAHKTDLGYYVKCLHQIFFLMNYIKNTSTNTRQVYLIHMCKGTTKESFDHQSMKKTIRRENTGKHILSDILILKEVGTLHFIMHKVL